MEMFSITFNVLFLFSNLLFLLFEKYLCCLYFMYRLLGIRGSDGVIPIADWW